MQNVYIFSIHFMAFVCVVRKRNSCSAVVLQRKYNSNMLTYEMQYGHFYWNIYTGYDCAYQCLGFKKKSILFLSKNFNKHHSFLLEK